MQETTRADERNELCPATWLELGLAEAAAGRHEDAIRHLRTARNLYDDPSVREGELRRGERVDLWRREAHYNLGRLLYEHSTDFADAVASLGHALEQAPKDPRLLLHLGLAIRAQVERQNLVEATRLLRAYVDAGAPLGRLDEIQDWLIARRG